MNMRDNAKLSEMLRFLALEHPEQVACLPSAPTGMELKIDETSIRTDSPLLCLGYEIFNLLEHRRSEDEVGQVLGEIECLLDLMIAKPDLLANIWGMAWQDSPHTLWAILRRLSRDALRAMSLPRGAPVIVLSDFMTVGKWVLKRSSVRRVCNDAFDALDLSESGFDAPVIGGDTLTVAADDV